MKATLYLFLFTFLSGMMAQAQLTEVEPNDSMPIANSLPVNTSMSGSACVFTDQDWFRIILPADGEIRIYTSVSTPDTVLEFSSGGLALTLYGTDGQNYAQYPVRSGSYNAARLDTFTYCCLAADTFYIWVNRGAASPLCWNYTLHYELLPATFTNDAEPDQNPGPAITMPYNTDVQGHLGFDKAVRTLMDNNDYYLILAPTDGILKVNVSSEAQSAPTHELTMQLYDRNHSNFSTQTVVPGDFQHPLDTILYWPCMGTDTLYISPYIAVFGDGGFAYKMRYTMLQPLFSNDVEPNNTFATAQQVTNPSLPIEGHQLFGGDNTDDYFKFVKPDTGFLKINIQVETSQPTAGGYLAVQVYDSTQNQISSISAPIGVNSQPVYDSIVLASRAAGAYYIHVFNPVFGAPCESYKLSIFTPTITDGIDPISTAKSIHIYPNPTAGSFTIDFGTTQNTTVAIYNTLGELTGTTVQKNERTLILGGNLDAGIYIIKATDDSGRAYQSKLVKTQ